MSNYTKTTNFAAKDSLPSGNAAKIVKGAEIDTEFNNIATASATKANANNAALTGTTVFETLSDGTIGVTGWVDEDNMSSDSAVLIPTQQSVKAYVDSQVTAQDLDVTDGSNSIDIDLDSESLGILGGTGVTSTASGTGVTLAIDSTVTTLTGTQTLTNKTLTTPVISGALTTNSTIDGRDVAVDGTKLDGIEASADVTDTTNVTAAGALMDSEVTNLAQVKAFDSSDYATAAQGTTADAALPKAGGAMTGAITTNSTFDGRDVATDGTKLDGIEASADVTDTANVTAAGALMDSELTNITAVKALNQGVATGDSPTFAGVTSPYFFSDDINFLNTPTSQIAVQIDTINSRLGIKSGSPDVTLDMQGAVDSIALPVGTTAQRPTGAAGMFRYNSSLEQFEGYTSEWGSIGGGGGTNTFTTDSFTGNGSTTAYALSQVTSSEDNLLVFIEGVFQQQDAYSIATASGTTTLTFSAAPANGNDILIYSVASAVSGSNLNIDSMTGDGSDTTLTLSIAPVNENNTQVFIDGVYQSKSNYSISGTTLTFSTAPPSGTAVEVMTFTQTDINVPVDGTITSAKLSGDLTTPGALTVTGEITANGGIALGDSDKATFGASDDLQIYHDGVHSRIVDAGTGNLSLQGNDLRIKNSDASATYIQAANGGAVTLHHNDAVTLATTSTGIDVTGTATMGAMNVTSGLASGTGIGAGGANGNLRLYANGAQVVTVATTGSVGIGTSSPASVLHATGSTGIILGAASGDNWQTAAIKPIDGGGSYKGSLAFYTHPTAASAGSPTERMRIDSSGNITTQLGTSMGLGRTDVTTAILSVYRGNSAEYAQEIRSDAVGAKAYIRFSYGGGTVGSIQGDNTSVSYNTSSDYRLKENVVAITGATERLKQLNPSRFNFIADADTTVDGFLAHEVQAVVPEAITGTKDAMRDEEYEVTPAVLDDDGNVTTEAVMGTRSVPDYQGIDQSKLVPLLVATIQELEARLTALENN